MTRPWRAMLRLAPLLVATSPGVAQGESMAVMGGLTVTESIGWPSSHRVFRGGAKCDAEGNVFFIPQPLMTLPEKGRYATTFVRVSRDGSKATTFRVADAFGGLGPDDFLSVAHVSVDPDGTPYALANVRQSDRWGQYVVSFARDGGHKALLQLDRDGMNARSFAALGSETFLVLGSQLPERDREVVVRADGHVLDVEGARLASPRAESGRPPMRLGPAQAGGRAYVLREGGSIDAIEAPGEVTDRIDLEAARPGQKLVDLQASSNRIAAIYFGRTADEPDASWVDIYDASAGIRIATYGPIPRLVMCYLQDGLRDRFILLGGEAEVRMSQASGR